MATTKKRINISVSDEAHEAVSLLAKRDQVPEATKVTELLTLALEIEEDTFFAHLIKERMQKKTAWVSHEVVWK